MITSNIKWAIFTTYARAVTLEKMKSLNLFESFIYIYPVINGYFYFDIQP